MTFVIGGFEESMQDVVGYYAKRKKISKNPSSTVGVFYNIVELPINVMKINVLKFKPVSTLEPKRANIGSEILLVFGSDDLQYPNSY